MFKKIIAAFFAVVFSALMVGCGTDMGNDISSDISSIMDPESNNTSTAPNSSNNNQNSSMPSNDTAANPKISKEEAKDIALKHANLKETDISDYDIDLDNEDGKLIYDISFEANGKEYDYDIDAHTGNVTNSMNELID